MEKGTFKKKLFGKRIKEQREKLGLTQEELAYDLGLSKNFLSDVERGIKCFKYNTLIKAANYFKVSLDTLFTDSLDNIPFNRQNIKFSDRQLAIFYDIVQKVYNNFDIKYSY